MHLLFSKYIKLKPAVFPDSKETVMLCLLACLLKSVPSACHLSTTFDKKFYVRARRPYRKTSRRPAFRLHMPCSCPKDRLNFARHSKKHLFGRLSANTRCLCKSAPDIFVSHFAAKTPQTISSSSRALYNGDTLPVQYFLQHMLLYKVLPVSRLTAGCIRFKSTCPSILHLGAQTKTAHADRRNDLFIWRRHFTHSVSVSKQALLV